LRQSKTRGERCAFYRLHRPDRALILAQTLRKEDGIIRARVWARW